LRYESSLVGFLKPRPKLTFGWVQGCYSYLDSATPTLFSFLWHQNGFPTQGDSHHNLVGNLTDVVFDRAALSSAFDKSSRRGPNGAFIRR